MTRSEMNDLIAKYDSTPRSAMTSQVAFDLLDAATLYKVELPLGVFSSIQNATAKLSDDGKRETVLMRYGTRWRWINREIEQPF